jgi:hypothetical protein
MLIVTDFTLTIHSIENTENLSYLDAVRIGLTRLIVLVSVNSLIPDKHGISL